MYKVCCVLCITGRFNNSNSKIENILTWFELWKNWRIMKKMRSKILLDCTVYSLLKGQYDEKSMAFYYIRCCQSSIKKRSFFQIVVVNIKSDSQKWADRMCTYFGMRSAIPDVPPTVDIGRERDFLVLQIISRHSQLILVCGLWVERVQFCLRMETCTTH